MVVFEGGMPKKSDYRRFKIRSAEGKPDDFLSMREVTTRRYVGLPEDFPKRQGLKTAEKNLRYPLRK